MPQKTVPLAVPRPKRLPVDPYIALLLSTVLVAALLPAKGSAATAAQWATNGAVALLFFLYGARLSTREALTGLRHWRLHLTVLAATFAVFPLLGLAARGLVPYVLAPQLYPGFLFLCLLPSTIQSSIAFTSIARGNVAAAICAGSFSSLAGIVLTPLLAAAFIGGGSGISAHALLDIALQLLAPFVAGQLLRGRISGFLTRHRTVLGRVDRGSILLVVYTAFSAGMAEGIWHKVPVPRLAELLLAEALLLALMLGLTSYGARRLGFGRADRITIVFAGSKKSLASGLPMATVLFGSGAGLAVLPLMLFHQMQLMVCAVIAKRWARTAEPGPAPGEEGVAPGGEGAAPGAEGAAPGAEGAAPGGEGAAPGGEGAALVRAAAAPPAAPPPTTT
ncbi:solute carrier family 10 (sodium/bile acid cotransporter), member 7 [Actinacidiphila alni]|uniref:Solute carrier family 10 (Sodium/bile acid cotransporter), member 7 n=1 Tax=Actinacidiphila alni TaxID=380248 RepID=A0A1I1X6Z7_9ACTN|nr:bile acid:sodium symporter family protein [Actinacidiphila alni]SFE03176.1 solute carrier family 10 (sodium/bile acid cotransporter), member 7 [Actinacidiphila alni]